MSLRVPYSRSHPSLPPCEGTMLLSAQCSHTQTLQDLLLLRHLCCGIQMMLLLLLLLLVLLLCQSPPVSGTRVRLLGDCVGATWCPTPAQSFVGTSRACLILRFPHSFTTDSLVYALLAARAWRRRRAAREGPQRSASDPASLEEHYILTGRTHGGLKRSNFSAQPESAPRSARCSRAQPDPLGRWRRR